MPLPFAEKTDAKIPVHGCGRYSAGKGSGVVFVDCPRNRISAEPRQYGVLWLQNVLNIAFWIVGNAICGALILWNEYQAEKRRNQSIRLQTQLLKEHEKVMEAQIQFSRRLQQEIREQLKELSRENRSLQKTEVKNYYERLLELSQSEPQKEYNSNPIINQFLIQKIGEWERDGHRASVLHHAPRMCETNTTAWLKVLQRLFQEMDHQSLRQHSAVILLSLIHI